jgi:KRAB domain-containing zinc finger protein
VKRTASSRESAARNSSSSSSSSSSSNSTGNRKSSFVRKEGHEYRFECDVCDYGTDNSSIMKRHEDMHAGVRYHCPNCAHASTTNSGLQKHIRTVHENRRDFECPECHKEFTQAGTLKTHRESVHEYVRHECPVAECDKSYTLRAKCVTHIRLEHGGDSSLTPIRRTIEEQIEASKSRNQSASSSSASSSSSSRRKSQFVRKEGHEYRFECDVCDYGTDQSGRMKIHDEMHAGVRYHCPNCAHASTAKTDLQRHIRTVHEKRKDFECPVCHKEFTQASGLKTHREAVHEGVRHECPVAECDKSYTMKGKCVNHIRLEHDSNSSLIPIRRTIEEQIKASKRRARST